MALAAMIGFAVAGGLAGFSGAVPAGIASWVAAACLITRTSKGQRIQIGVMTGIALVVLAVAMSMGATPDLAAALHRNHGLLTMLASISFLRLITMSTSAQANNAEKISAQLAPGKSGLTQSLLNVAVFGSVINMTSALLVLDKIEMAQRLDDFSTKVVTRVFSGCSGWSPFYGGMAAIITYVAVPDVSKLILGGLPFALIGLVLTWCLAVGFDRERVANFRGVPMDPRNLWIPALLAVTVFALSQILSGVSILLNIALGAIGVSLAVLLLRYGPGTTLLRLREHITTGLPSMSGELFLFLAAGLLAVALSALLDVTGLTLPLTAFGAFEASLVVTGILALSIIGIHPIIPISSVTPFLLPLDPDPTLLGIAYLQSWSLGTSASFLSGTHLIIQGRYGIPSHKAAVANFPFAAIMLCVGIGLLFLYERLLAG